MNEFEKDLRDELRRANGGDYDLGHDVLNLHLAWPRSWGPLSPDLDLLDGEIEVTGSLEAMALSVPDR